MRSPSPYLLGYQFLLAALHMSHKSFFHSFMIGFHLDQQETVEVFVSFCMAAAH